jgi:hypothetical protein
MIKFLAAITCLQALVLVGLVFHTWQLQDSLNNLSEVHQARLAAPPTGVQGAEGDGPPAAVSSADRGDQFLLDNIRMIVREELRPATVATNLSFTDADLPRDDDRVDARVEDSDEEYAALIAVNQTLDEHIARGSTSREALAELETLLVELGPGGRKAVLHRFARAVNTGELGGPL